MGSSAIPAAVMARDPEDLRAAIVSELVPIIASNVDPQTWDPRELPGVGGNTWQAVIWQERIWYRDEDSLVDHDELTCIRLLDGVAYLTNDVTFPGFVLSRTLATPPLEVDRVYGDTHRIPAGATDEWAGHEDEDAMWTARGYRFRAPVTGDLHYVVDEAGYEHFSAADEWEDGFGALVFENGSVRPNSLLIRSWNVENQTTNTLPLTGSAAEQYIVGPSPTGSAAGQSKKIAWRPATDAAFIFTAPFVGERAFDKALNIDVRWNGTAWEGATASIVGMATPVVTQASASATAITGLGVAYTYQETGAPNTGYNRYLDPAFITYRAKSGDNMLRIKWRGKCTFNTAAPFVFAVFKDSLANAVSWDQKYITNTTEDVDLEFVVDAVDDSEHTYKLAVMEFPATGYLLSSVSHRLFQCEEIAT